MGGDGNGVRKRRWIPLLVGSCAFGALALASWFVPRRTLAMPDSEGARIERGPASYFHHFYDPDGLLGPVGKVDLDLDNFERTTTHSILVAAFRTAPGNDPDFAMKLAEKWRPGVKGRDNGVLVAVFLDDRRIRAEVGYGLEDVLPDADMARALDEGAVPAFRRGDYAAGLDSALARVCDQARTAAAAERPTRVTPWLAAKQGLRAVPRAARVAGAVLLAADFAQRLGASFFIVLLGGIAAKILGDVVRSGRTVVDVVRRERDIEGARKVGDALFRVFYDAAKVAIVFFVIAIGGSYFFAGTGQFGGGGVDVFW